MPMRFVDTFHDHDKAQLINDFKQETFKLLIKNLA